MIFVLIVLCLVLFEKRILAMSQTLEISLQMLDEWIQGVSECQLLSKPEVEKLCEKVGIWREVLARRRKSWPKNQMYNR